MNTTTDQSYAATTSSPAYQAYWILHVGFTVAPILAGLDKFFHLLVNWDQYLPGVVANASPIPAHTLMLIVGVIEVVAGIGVWFKPRIFAYIVAIWLVVIILDLLLIPGYFDVALRDFGLLLAALALGQLLPAAAVRPAADTRVGWSWKSLSGRLSDLACYPGLTQTLIQLMR